jgi:hypothetical protein
MVKCRFSPPVLMRKQAFASIYRCDEEANLILTAKKKKEANLIWLAGCLYSELSVMVLIYSLSLFLTF